MSVDTERFRSLLLDEREDVVKAIDKLRADHGGAPDEVEEISGASDNHLAETASVTLEREIDATLEENSSHVLFEIDAALQRIDAGVYGSCSGCDREIPQERLEAYPWAALCIECARAAERP